MFYYIIVDSGPHTRLRLSMPTFLHAILNASAITLSFFFEKPYFVQHPGGRGRTMSDIWPTRYFLHSFFHVSFPACNLQRI